MKDKMLFISSEIEKASSSKKDKNLKIAGYANTTAKDRAGDIVTANAWAKGVDNFRRNPVLLYQHKHDCPIGKVNKITVDKKGIFVEAAVSEAAESNHGIQTLIKDGALKSFSVGFKVKDGKYNRDEDSMYITDVELLEISVVSVPCNQDSLFSVRKSFETDDDYTNFVDSFKSEESSTKEEKAAKIKAGITDLADGHYHTVEMDKKGDGVTTYASHMANHAHKIKDGVLEAADGHTHEISMVGVAVHDTVGPDSDADVSTRPLSPSEQESTNNDSAPKVHAEGHGQVLPVAEASSEDLEIEIKNEEEEILDIEGKEEEDEEDFDLDPNTPIPFLNLLSTETSQINNGDFVKYDNVRYKVTKIATAQSATFKFLEVDLQGKDCDNNVDVNADEIFVVNTWDMGSKFDIIIEDFGDVPETLIEDFNKYCNATEADLYKFKDSWKLEPQEQEKLNTLINIKLTPSSEWNALEQKFAHIYTQKIKALLELNTSEAQEDSNISLALKLHGYFKKENDTMAEQVVDTIDLTSSSAEKIEETTEQVIEEKAAPVAQVSEPEVAKLVEKTGKAVMKESDAAEKAQVTGASYKQEIEELEELKSQISKYKDEVKALTETKMVYQESQRNTQQFSEKEMANAYLLAACMNKRDPFDTKMGSRMKAITSVDQFLSNFSSNIYTEMEQQLVIAPMFNRIAVDARNFRVPVADEDTDGDVAQFASGTFATGVGDTTNVPTSNQNTISAVTFTPHKFMATTHLAKDEEEDTVLPLLDFLRAAATRRLARAIDKSILRGRGNLTGFTAAPTNAITAGSGYASVMKGVTTLANDASLTATTGSGSDKVDPTDIASARGTLGKYGLQLGDQLVYLTTIEGYNNLVTTSDFRTVDKFGPNATYLTGSVGAVYGIPIQITEFLDNVGSTGNQIGALVYKPGFMIAERRGMEIESEYEPRQQVTAMYLSTRFDFKALTTNSSAALDSSKYSYACQVKTG
jgi:HK97 family phage prohead protease/HK97 family phage major capsid protein